MQAKILGPKPNKEIVLTKAFLNAAGRFNISRSEIVAILGISEASLSRIFNQTRYIDPASKEGELAILFIKIYRGLANLLGGDLSECQRWMRNANPHLNGIPLELVKSITGLMAIVQYLEYMREKI